MHRDTISFSAKKAVTMSLRVFVTFTLILSWAAAVKILPFPKEFHRCRLKDPKLNECARKAAQGAIPYISKGMPKYGITGIDPMFIPSISVMQGNSIVSIDLYLTNISYIGNAGVKIREVKVDVDYPRLYFDCFFPHVILKGKYDMKASVLFVPLQGKGNFQIAFDNVTARIDAQGAMSLRKGLPHFLIKRAPVDLELPKIEMDFENLVNKNGIIGREVNRFLNRNSQRIVKDLAGVIEGTQTELVERLAQPFFDHVPFTQLFS